MNIGKIKMSQTKKELIALGIFFISLFFIGLLIFNVIDKEIIIVINDTEQAVISQPFSLIQVLALMILAVIASISLFYYLEKLNFKKGINQKQKTILSTLEGDEKKVYDFLLQKGEILQKDLVYELGLSKAKVSRILDKLERKEILKRYSYGFSNKVKLN